MIFYLVWVWFLMIQSPWDLLTQSSSWSSRPHHYPISYRPLRNSITPMDPWDNGLSIFSSYFLTLLSFLISSLYISLIELRNEPISFLDIFLFKDTFSRQKSHLALARYLSLIPNLFIYTCLRIICLLFGRNITHHLRLCFNLRHCHYSPSYDVTIMHPGEYIIIGAFLKDSLTATSTFTLTVNQEALLTYLHRKPPPTGSSPLDSTLEDTPSPPSSPVVIEVSNALMIWGTQLIHQRILRQSGGKYVDGK